MLITWWQQRTQREQYLLSISSIGIAVLLLYTLVWKPVHTQLTDLQHTIKQKMTLLTWMNAAADHIDQFRTHGYIKRQVTHQALLTITEQSLIKNKLSQYVSNTQEKSSQHIRITLKNAPFDRITDWLETLWKQHNITVDTLTARRTHTEGLTNATIALKS